MTIEERIAWIQDGLRDAPPGRTLADMIRAAIQNERADELERAAKICEVKAADARREYPSNISSQAATDMAQRLARELRYLDGRS